MAPSKFKNANGRPLTGGDLLALSLKARGVDVAFGIHGGHLDGFLLGCEQNGIRLVDTRHETPAVQAAEAYYKVSGKVGVCFITANSGFANGLPGLATALADKSAIVCVTSSQPHRAIDTNGLQGSLDQIVVAKPLVKFAHRIAHSEEIPRVLAHAFQVAATGGPGPVLLDLPVDLQFGPVVEDKISYGSIYSPVCYRPGPDSEAISQVVSLWKRAKRPVLLAGTGTRLPSCTQLLCKVAELTSTPVFHSLNFGPTLPIDHPLQAGYANRLAQLKFMDKPRPDLVILIGARLGTFTGGRGGRILPDEGCEYVQIDTDGTELGKILPVDVGIVSDAELALRAISQELEKEPFKVDRTWVELATSLKAIESPYEKVPTTGSDGKTHPYHALKKLFSSLKPGAIICSDGGESSFWGLDLAEYCKPHMVFFSLGYLGFLGNGWGYSIGAAVAAPNRQIINIQGDGSAGFHIAELDTNARFNLNILTVVVNNAVWAMSLHAQDILYADKIKERPAAKLSAGTAYELVGQGFENHSSKIDNVEDIERVVKSISEEPGPGCINLIVSEPPIHPGLEALVLNTLGSDKPLVPYYG